MNLSKQAKWTRVSNAVAAGTTEVDGAVINMSGFEGICFSVAFGAIVSGAATAIKIQQGTKADASDMADVAGSKITVADTADNQIFVTDIFQPDPALGSYVRCVVTRATQNSTVDSIVAVQYRPRFKPTTHDATTVGGTLFMQSPALGTA